MPEQSTDRASSHPSPAFDEEGRPVPLGGPLFTLDHETPTTCVLTATEYGRSPWSHEMLHGGPVVGALAWTCERAAATASATGEIGSDFMCSRLTVEMLRSVPVASLEARAIVVKPGRRTAMIDASLEHQGELVARASSLWLLHRPSDPTPEPEAADRPPPRPTENENPRAQTDFDYPIPGFNCDTSELRYVSGSHEEEGPGTSWIRLHSQVVEGQANSGFVAVAAISDLAAAAGWETGPNEEKFINPDVTLQLSRYPRSDWLAMAAKAGQGGNGVALMEARLWDDYGPIGRILQSLVETPMQLDADASG